MVNFDMLDLLQRKHRIQAINDIVSDCQNNIDENIARDIASNTGKSFVFPRETNSRFGVNSAKRHDLPTVEELKKVLENAKLDAILHAEEFGMALPDELKKKALEESTLPPIREYLHAENHGSAMDSENEPDADADADEDADGDADADADVDAHMNNINSDDLVEIEKELNHFTGIEILNIKDYSSEKSESDSSMLNITMNGKKMLVKKSTLCWFFADKKGKLSSDRQIRCRGMSTRSQNLGQMNNSTSSSTKKKQNKKPSKKSTNHHVEETSDSESDVCYSEKSEFENESFSEEESNGEKETSICIEKYYAAIYDTWYIGRILEILENDTFRIKFLKSELDMYIWPNKEDIQVVEKKYILYGPIDLVGNGPFRLKRIDVMNIEKKYKDSKKQSIR